MTKIMISIAMLTLISLLGSTAFGVWAKPADADYSSESEKLEFEIDTDGTYTLNVERTIQILKESARLSMGVSHHYYDPEVTDYHFNKAYTQNGDDILPVAPKFIEDKAFASGSEGFDSRNQISVAFPDVKVGSKLYESYSSKVHKIPVKNFFSQKYYFGLNQYEKQAVIHIKSKIPLFLDINDPEKKLSVKQTTAGSRYEATIQLTAPLFTRVIHEKNALINESDKTWVAISNVHSYAEVMGPLATKYEEVSASGLPPEFEKIVEKAKTERDISDQLNVVTSELAELVRYVGDWREVKGAYEPHALKNIVQTKFGDCKDFAVSTTAMLRKLGFKANVVAIERGKDPSPLNHLPLLNAFNHAMVRLEVEGKVRWLDPTNFQSFAQGLFEDVADREALVLEPGNLRIERTSPMKSSEGTVVSQVDMSFFKDGDVALEGTVDFKGRQAVPITGARMFSTKEELSYQMATSFFPDPNLKEYQIEGLDLTSRVVRDVQVKVHLRAKNTSLKTSAGDALRIPDASVINTIAEVDLRTRVSDLQLEQPNTLDLNYKLDNVKLVGNRLYGCQLNSPWLDAELKISQRGNGILVHDKFVTKSNIVSKDHIHSDQFKTFQKKFKDCFENVAVVYLPTGSNKNKVPNLSSIE